ncbi:hypothetical protein [Streptomyces sp. BE133]|uniref:hypothetical protein n=1 Tax=Streptomyces sp. BE133 TaxID=3002523 RepID=UPI002E7A58EE|nr:hypothetical protein [Streptomyces sp. BE133]
MGGDERTTFPEAAVMRSYTSEFVARLTARNRLPLDYSVASLRLVDLVVDGLRRDQPQRNRVAGTLLGLGAYTGKVIVRRAGGGGIPDRPNRENRGGNEDDRGRHPPQERPRSSSAGP